MLIFAKMVINPTKIALYNSYLGK